MAYLFQSKNDRARVYEYYRDIESYPLKYPTVYGEIKVVKPGLGDIDVKIQPPGERISEDNQFTARFMFFPQNEIRYEVINGYGKGTIKNSIIIMEPSGDAIRRGYKCEVEVNHLPLDIIKFDLHWFEEPNPMSMSYHEMVMSLKFQDYIRLEGMQNLDEVRDCPKCGEEKSVHRTDGRSETDRNKKTIWLQCEKCGKEFRDISIVTSDGLGLHG